MSASYKKLWKLLIDKYMKKRDFCKLVNVSPISLSKLSKGDNMNTDIMIRVCNAQDFDVGDITEIFLDNDGKLGGVKSDAA